jgi:bacillaene synthase trans-acting acyltransferase/trans-AT polyketide synthase/acyltransferase/oxidoreductase domain-containing protein
MKKPVVFMFSGQGSQYFQMGRELYDNNPRFALWMDYCDEIAEPLLDASLVEIIYQQDKSKSDPFDHIVHSNPALLCIEYCLAKVLMEMDIQPDYLLGYSLGEFTASVVSGAIDLEEGIELAIEFAKLLEQEMPPASMLAVIDSPSLLKQYPELFDKVWLTGVNFANNFVLSGLHQDIGIVEAALKEKDVITQRLPVNYGFHTKIIDPLQARFKQLIENVDIGAITIPTISSLTTKQIDAVDGDYFWQVVRQPVDFEQTVKNMMQTQDYIFIDVGPSGTLATFIKYNRSPESNSAHFEVMNQFGKDLKTLDKLSTNLAKLR